MGFVKKEKLPICTQDEEVVTVDELGGDVLVRSPSLDERLQLAFGEKSDIKKVARFSQLLEVCVLDGDGNRLMTAEEWGAFGGKNLSAAIRLWDIAWRLADFNGERAEKNSKAPTSD